MWILPLLIIVTTILLSFPFGRYLAWIMDGRYNAPRWLKWFEERLDTGPQNWKQYTVAVLLFNTMAFVVGFAILQAQALLPLNPDYRGTLSPTTVFNTVTSFMTNTNLQHYSGDQHLSHFSQVGFILWNMFTSAAVGFCVLTAIIRGLRGDSHMGNYYRDMWRVVVYAFLPASLFMGVLLMADGQPMTFEGQAQVATVEEGAMGTAPDGQPNPQMIVRGPVAAIMPIKHLGTNGGGFYGANSAHPYENPTAWSNFLTCVNILIFPLSLIVMFGRVLNNMRHAMVIYSVMTIMFFGMAGWAIYWDTLQPNPGLTARARKNLRDGRSQCPRRKGHPHRSNGGGVACRSGIGKSGRQGIAFRHLGRRHFRRHHNSRHVRFGQLHARQPEPAGWDYAAHRDVAQLRLWW